MVKNKLKLGVIQMMVTDNKENCLKKALDNIRMLSERGAKLIVLPEMFNCPYETHLFPMYAEKEGDETFQALSAAAKEGEVYVIAGSVPEKDYSGVYNTSYIFNPRGELIGKHRKLHMLDIDIRNGQYFMESETLVAGDDYTVVDTEYGKIGVAICYDIRFPELARAMVKEGASVLVYPATFNMTTGPAHWEMLFRSRAVDNQVFTVGCAPARNYQSQYISYGHSIVVNPWGDVIGELGEEEGFLIGTLELEQVNQIREQLPLLKHLRTDVY